MELLGFSLRCINPGVLSMLSTAVNPWARVGENWLKRALLVCEQAWAKPWLCGGRWYPGHRAYLVRSLFLFNMTSWMWQRYFCAANSDSEYLSSCSLLPVVCCMLKYCHLQMCACVCMHVDTLIGMSVFPGLDKSWTHARLYTAPVISLLQFHRQTGAFFPLICKCCPSFPRGVQWCWSGCSTSGYRVKKGIFPYCWLAQAGHMQIQ